MDQDRARGTAGGRAAANPTKLAALERPEETPEDEDLDAGDQATDLYQDELDESRDEDLREQLAAVERAEERLARVTYGMSTENGLPIPDERLKARPTAELTVEEERARAG